MGELAGLPARRDGVIYLTESGIETEIMYKRGYELPEFAMFPLLENPEVVGLARAVRAQDVPLTISLTVTDTGRLRSGPSVAEAVTAIDAQTGGSVAFFGLNCSHPVEFMPGLEAGDWSKRMRSFRPNASKMEKIALCKLGHLEEGDPDELGVLMGELAGTYPHMDVWGGCCGTGDLHLRQIARAVKAARGLTP